MRFGKVEIMRDQRSYASKSPSHYLSFIVLIFSNVLGEFAKVLA